MKALSPVPADVARQEPFKPEGHPIALGVREV
jgi:hypothetical protein